MLGSALTRSSLPLELVRASFTRSSWSHWTSKDLIHWSGSFKNGTGFGGDTGSVSPTKSGVYAFWPIMSGAGKGAIGSAVADPADPGYSSWKQRGPTIPMPARINTGYRDPVRAFQVRERLARPSASRPVIQSHSEVIIAPVIHFTRTACFGF